MRRLAVTLDVAERRVLVVGGGAVAERKVATLLDCGARVTLVAPEATPRLQESDLDWQRRGYQPGDLDGMALVFACTADPDLNRRIAGAAAERGIWCNAASPLDAGDCQVMATVERGGITIGLGTEGASPFAARKIRELVEAAVPPELGALARLLGELRGEVKARHAAEDERRAAYQRMWESEALADLRAGDEDGARERLRAVI